MRPRLDLEQAADLQVASRGVANRDPHPDTGRRIDGVRQPPKMPAACRQR